MKVLRRRPKRGCSQGKRGRSVTVLGLAVLTLVSSSAFASSAFAMTVAQSFNAQSTTTSAIAVSGTNHSLDVWFQTVGSQYWQEDVVNSAPYSAETSPSAAQVGDSFVVASTDDNQDLEFYWDAFDSTRWSPPQQVDPAQSGDFTTPPAVAQIGTGTGIAAQTSSGLYYYYQPIGGKSWAKQSLPGSYDSGMSPAIAQVGNSVVIAAVDIFGDLNYWWEPIGTDEWQEQNVQSSSTSTVDSVSRPAITEAGNSTVIAEVDAIGDLNFYYQPIGAGGWTRDLIATPGNDYANPSVAAVGNEVDVTVTNWNGNLLLYQGPGNGSNGFATVPEYVNSTYGSTALESSVAKVAESTVIAAPGANNTLDYYWQTIGSTQWHPEVPISGAVAYGMN
jgi:hypothetical protein